MNRERKFRAWDGERMLYSENAQFYLKPNGKIEIPSSTGHEFYERDYPVMDFTGLKDQNNVLIYRRDNIKANFKFEDDTLPIAGTVEYSNVLAAYVLKNEAGETPLYKLIMKTIEVVGNVFETPDLIK